MVQRRERYTGERTFGLDKCPINYTTLLIRVTTQQNYDMYPTLTKSELYADDYKFLAPSKMGCNVSATDATLREVHQLAKAVAKGSIHAPKETVIQTDNVLAYLILTQQVENVIRWRHNKATYAKSVFQRHGPVKIVLCDCSDLMPRQWTGDICAWRDISPVQQKTGLTLIEDGKKLKRLFTQAKKRKIEAFYER